MSDSDERLACPRCGKPSAYIAYGLQAPDEEMYRDMEEDRIVLGGCLIDFDDPTHHCLACHLDIWPDGRSDRKVRA